MITTVEQMIEQYVSAWNENNFEDYHREFSKCWTDETVYSDPLSEKIEGLAALSQFAEKSLAIVPNRKFSVLEKPDYHHQFGKYTWMVEYDGQTNTGYDYFEFNESFKITRLISFFKLPEDYPVDKLL
ncbi:nuclear transport factor 2 family protein [Flavobacterium sp. MC2016-06]|jgi:hypothetical protein|uniref:nuclear transport factor 2 family protein n=1 Tax=Flavobacterium sp. MC2016-06 TaxID=2676308 RepID=UPI0012BACB21|nr:nuclear transport factor 2 family protein [Flavobacterium sp. MC2016-06]MBU3861865.1 nuclear transport factor 2 family protein [Flavobacterium sp. MC2016-06]